MGLANRFCCAILQTYQNWGEMLVKKLLSKSILISLFCTLFQYYAFSVYAFSAVILSPIFFHSESLQLTKTIGLFTLSITLLLKPIGSVLFGHIGDKRGRKKALIYSLTFITLATTAIGLIPTYASIGWISSALLLLCLFTQGLCMAGQYAGAIVFIQEHMDRKHAAFSCSLVGAIGVFGTLLGTGTSYLFYYLNDLDWEWRLPFLFTFVIGAILLVATKWIDETPAFVENKSAAKKFRMPLVDILKNHKVVLLSSVLLSSISVAMFYLSSVYLPNFYGNLDDLDHPFNTLSLTCMAQVFSVIFIPIFGYTADRFGKENQLKFASFSLMVFPFCIFYLMTIFNSIPLLITGILLLSTFVSLYAGPAPAYLSEKLPVIGRYTGLGLGISLGEGLIGGSSPLICVGLEEVFDSKLGPALYIVALGVLSYIGLCLARKKQRLPSKINPLTRLETVV